MKAVPPRVNFIKGALSPRFLICFIPVYAVVYGTPVLFGVPDAVKFLMDAALALLAVLTAAEPGRVKPLLRSPLGISLLLLTGYCIVSAIVSGCPVLPAVWDLRNLLRPIFFAAVCICHLTEELYRRLMRVLMKLYWVNAVCFVLQFALGVRGDYLGGLFGCRLGVNGSNNLLFCMLAIYQTARYLNGEDNRIECLSTLLSSMLLAAMCELKVYAFEAVGIVAAVSILHALQLTAQGRKREIAGKRIVELIVCLLISYAGALVIYYFSYPLAFKQMTQADRIVHYEASVRNHKLGRFGAWKKINEMFFPGDWIGQLFGFGFGSFVDSNTAFLQGSFYPEYAELNYSWFTFQLNYLEGGLVGVALYFAALTAPGLTAFIRMARGKCREHFVSYACSVTICPIMLMLYFYNNSLRSEIAYGAFLMLAAFEAMERRQTDDIRHHPGE